LQIKLTSFLACLQFLVFYNHSMVASVSKVFSNFDIDTATLAEAGA